MLSSIQRIQVLGFNEATIEQLQTGRGTYTENPNRIAQNKFLHTTSQVNYRSETNPINLIDKTLNVEFRHTLGFVNYFMAIDLFNHYYSFENKATHLPCSFDINITDSESTIVSTLHFEDVLLTSVSGLEFNFSSNTVDYKTFELTFAYNIFEIILNYK